MEPSKETETNATWSGQRSELPHLVFLSSFTAIPKRPDNNDLREESLGGLVISEVQSTVTQLPSSGAEVRETIKAEGLRRAA